MKTIRLLILAAVTCFTAMAADSRKKADVVNLFCWSEYVPQSVIDAFTKETGINVNVENYDSNEKMLAKLLAGGAKYDLIQPSEYVVESLIKQGRLEELNHANLTNLGNLDPRFTNMTHDPGNKHSVPWMTGSVGIVVNTDRIKDEVSGYADLFSGKYKKRILVLDDNREIVSWALATLGIPINDINKDTLAKAKPVVKAWLPQVRAFDSDSPKTKFLKGDVDIGIVWSGEAAILWQESKGSGKFRFMLPKEGTHMFIDSLCIPKGAPHRANAEKFINFILKPEISALISKDFPYTNPNKAARELLSKEQLDNPASYPRGEPKLDFFKDIGKTARDVDKTMTDLPQPLMQGTTDAAETPHGGKRPGLPGWLLLLPMLLWLLAFVVAPTGILLYASFTHADEDTGFPVYRQPESATLTIENYKRIVFDDEGRFFRTDEEDIVAQNPDGTEHVTGTRKVTVLAAPYLRVFASSLLYAGIATVLCVLIGYPVAWHIGRAREDTRNRLLLLVMIPFWTSFLIRTYAWITILASEGLLNGLLLYTKTISEPFGMLYTPGAVVLGLVYSYLPFMILPIYGSVEKLDHSLVEAALDLGARPLTAFRRVILPLTRPGVATGVLLVFVPAVGMYAISTLMGGGKSPMIGDVIQNQFFAARDWPFGSALGITLVFMFAVAFVLTSRLRASLT